MSDSAIHVEQLSKVYRIGGQQERYRTLRDTIGDAAAAPLRRVRASLRRASQPPLSGDDNTIRALDNVSFEVRRGEVVGIIGRNGAGKSTLLKILSRITEPSAGFAEIRGRVGSLLEVGTGFHPELTGRENIFLNGAILGMRRSEIERKFDEIVDFAEVARFIDTPVKHFSSGMYLRLAFAVAAHMETEILLVDEVLAVGDVSFQRKCLGKMQEVGDTGRTVLFVSHDMTAIARLAGRTVLLDGGRVGFFGTTDDAIGRYVSQGEPMVADLRARSDRQGDGVIRMDSIQFFNAEGQAVDSVGSGDALTIAIGYSSSLRSLHPDDIMLDMRFRDALSHPIATFSTRFSTLEAHDRMGTSGVLLCQIPSLSLAEETYGVDLWLAYRGYRTDAVARAKDLRVVAANYYGTGYLPVKRKHGAALIRHTWEVAHPES